MLPISSVARRPTHTSVRSRCFSVALASLLAACGGGNETATTEASGGNPALSRAAEAAPTETAGSVPSAHDQALIAQGAHLSSAELLAAEQQADAPGAAQPRSAYASGQVMAKALATRIPVYRFYNGSTGAHFFTTSVAERDHVQANLSPPFSFEGPAFSVASAFSPGLSPVHRFFNTRSGVHFYTISESERAHVVANLPQFSYEGVAYHASQVAGNGLVPFYRFYVPSRGFHFYTASLGERDNIIANLGGTYSYEGVGYYVLASDWRAPAVPHTGARRDSCFEAGNIVFVDCSSPGAQALYAQQDGMREAINPMSYSEVPRAGGGTYARTECVRDNVTGLVWEDKQADGELRAATRTFSNLDNGEPTDASGYVTMVNGTALCGFTDWRMPTARELLTLTNLVSNSPPAIDTAWFPNSTTDWVWGAGGFAQLPSHGWVSSFAAGLVINLGLRSEVATVRLVRGGPAPSAARFSYSTVAYGLDAANNVVNDAWTGLQWRRCEEGRTWSGSACTGAAFELTHEHSLVHARGHAGWRIPNFKELASLIDLSVVENISPVAFPGAINSQYVWTSTPGTGSGFAYFVQFGYGVVSNAFRTTEGHLRLVRDVP